MKKNTDKGQEALNQALDALIAETGHSPEVILGDGGVLAQKKLPGFQEKIIALYARGMTVRDIKAMLESQYRIEVSPDFISSVTDAVHAEVTEWQNRPLERMYPLVFFDALRVRIRDEGTVRNKAVYLALGVAADGTREVLGLWIEQNEGAKF